MTTTDALLHDLGRALNGDPWHGPSLSTLLHRCAADDAAREIIPGAHSIWAIVLHLTAWTDEVRMRLDGKPPSDPAAGDWPAVPSPPTAAAWRRDREALAAAHAALEDAVRELSPRRLSMLVGRERIPALGTGMTFRATISGLIQHHAYHGGQIALLRRALRRR